MLTPAERERYGRHLILPEFGEQGQARLRAASVVIVGAGGLGSPAALYLVAAGVGRVGLVDFDSVDLTNLQRQVLYSTDDVGTSKLDAATTRLQGLNPEVTIERHAARLSAANARQILGGYDLILDGTDNFSTRFLVNDAALLLGKPNVYGSVYRFDGQVSVFATANGPCYRCVYPTPPPAEVVPSCAEGGVLGVLPGLVGMMQATEAIKLLAGIGETLIGRLLVIDALRMTFRTVRVPKRPSCICSDPATIRLQDIDFHCEVPGDEVNAAQLREILGNDARPLLVDVREPAEFAAGHLEGARPIPVGELERRAAELPRDAEIILYCRSGARSARALAALRAAGFTRVRHLAGGMLAWRRDVDPTTNVL